MKLVTTHPLTIVLTCASIAAIGIVAHAIEKPADTTICVEPRVHHAMPMPDPIPPTIPAPPIEPDLRIMPAPAE